MWPFGKSVAQRVQEDMDRYAVLKDMPVAVSEKNGTVFFQGLVPNQAAIALLTSVAEGVSGVKAVDTSGLSIEQHQSVPPVAEAEFAKAVQSSALAKKVYAAIKANGELADDPIEVLQSGSNVILRGAVDNQHEHNLAVQIAQGVAGVGAVEAKELTVQAAAKSKFQEAQKAPVNIPDAWHIVKPGDTLSAIALKYYGDASKEAYMRIAKANNLANPDLIRVGQKLQIPL